MSDDARRALLDEVSQVLAELLAAVPAVNDARVVSVETTTLPAGFGPMAVSAVLVDDRAAAAALAQVLVERGFAAQAAGRVDGGDLFGVLLLHPAGLDLPAAVDPSV